MELLLSVLLAVIVLVGFDLVALRYGVDSRPGIGDDHQQPFTPRWI